MSSIPSSRRDYAPRRGRGGWTKPFKKPKHEYVKPNIEKHPLGQLLKMFSESDLKLDTANPLLYTPISDLRYVTSYNWCEGTTILVPGKPPQWTPLQKAQRLKQDSGQYYRDPNAARYPDYPIAPVVQAVLAADPRFPTEEVDVLACGSTLGNLLRFVRGQDKAFRFAIETFGNTVFLLRKENDPKEIIQNVRGFGHSFPEAYTTWEKEVKGSETHQRIVQYEFGGLNCLVRFECDGYIKSLSTSDELANDQSANSCGLPDDDDDDLLDAFGKSTISQPGITRPTILNGITIEHGGAKVSQSSIFDLKTRSGKYNADIDMSDIYPQLWVKQIPNFIIAYHDGAGLFQEIRVQDVREDVREWEKDNIDAIRRLNVLLREIVAFAREDAGLLEVYSPGADRLEIRKQHGEDKSALPLDLRDKWMGKLGADLYFSDTDESHYALDGGRHFDDRSWRADSDEEVPDYTACSAEDCGYCGKCSY